MNARACLVAGALLALLAVAAGAFGAHALRGRLAPDALAVWQTAVQYHGFHALAVLGVGLYLGPRPAARAARSAAALFVAGIVLFAGSLYALSLSGARALSALTPIGGLAFLAGWAAFAWAAWREPADPRS
ncbi:MAG: DUF423 domain-containing protein [Burkholderiales bacterium]